MQPYAAALEEISRFENEFSYISRQFLASRSGPVPSSTVELNMTKIREMSPTLFVEIIQAPYLYIPAIEEHINSNHYTGDHAQRVSVLLTGDVTADHTTLPRNLNSACLKQLFKVTGIVTKLTAPRPSISRLIEFQPTTGTFLETMYEDPYTTIAPESMRGFILRQHSMLFTEGETGPVAGEAGVENAPFITLGAPGSSPSESRLHRATASQATVREYGLSAFDNVQKILVQDNPEYVPSGRLPRSIPVILRNHLIDKCKSGDLVEILGIFNPSVHHRAGETSNTKSSSIGNFLLALSINVIERTPIRHITTAEEHVIRFLKRCTDISRWMRHNNSTRLISLSGYAFDVLAASFAPAIYGHWIVKKGIVLQLLQGVPREFSSSSRIRGDINILLIGDPGSAKSQMLRVVKQLVPISVQTTGRGSSGVGLTAAVVIDGTTGERRLDPGAAVLADRGVLLIDEFDKVDADDRALLHEALEQQSISISKAGLHCTLNARCSVLAAANPIYGFFDPKRSFAENIALPDSLLSRYDLVFLVRDDHTMDAKIASHVLLNHMTSMSLDALKAAQEQRKTLEQGIEESLAELNNQDANSIPGDNCVDIYIRNKLTYEEESSANNTPHKSKYYDMYKDQELTINDKELIDFLKKMIEKPSTEQNNSESNSETPRPLSFDLMSPLYFQSVNDEIHHVYTEKLRSTWNSEVYLVNRARALLSHGFLRDVIKYARSLNRSGPYMSDRAVKQVAKCYTDLRQRAVNARRHPPNIPVTARILESLIRLSTALAKLSFPPREVEPEDVIEAYILLVVCIYSEKEESVRGTITNTDVPADESRSSEDTSIDARSTSHGDDDSRGAAKDGQIDTGAYSIVVRAISAYTEENGLTAVQLSDFIPWMKARCRSTSVQEPTDSQIDAAIARLVEDQTALLEDGVLFILT